MNVGRFHLREGLLPVLFALTLCRLCLISVRVQVATVNAWILKKLVGIGVRVRALFTVPAVGFQSLRVARLANWVLYVALVFHRSDCRLRSRWTVEADVKSRTQPARSLQKRWVFESLLLLSKFVQSCHSCCIIEEIITFFAPSISDARDKITRTISRLLCPDVYVLTTKILRSLVDLITHNLF